jgi:hypothetical protein
LNQPNHTASAAFFWLSAIAFGLAVGAWLYARDALEVGEAPNYATAVVLAVTGAVSLVVGAIFTSKDR